MEGCYGQVGAIGLIRVWVRTTGEFFTCRQCLGHCLSFADAFVYGTTFIVHLRSVRTVAREFSWIRGWIEDTAIGGP
jgi:hypothetical protein